MAAVGSESCVSGSLVAASVRGLCTVLVAKSGAVEDDELSLKVVFLQGAREASPP